MSSFQNFVESLENVPPELERNLRLITDLDTRTKEVMARIDECIKSYRLCQKKSERLELRRQTEELFGRLSSYADDKVRLAEQTYELIDRNIEKMTRLGQAQVSTEEDTSEPAMIGCDMPLDPNEPIYCVCRGVSHGEMVACDNKECVIEWFHYACVGLRSAPKGKWYCGQCYSTIARKPKSRSKRRR